MTAEPATALVEVPADLKAEVPTVLDWARQLVVTTPEQYAAVAESSRNIKAMIVRIREFFAPLEEKQKAALDALVERRQSLVTPLMEADDISREKAVKWQAAEKVRAKAEEAKRQAESNARVKAERDKLEAEAARQRAIEAEARAKAEADRKAAEEADTAERKRLLAQAKAAEKKAEAAAEKQNTAATEAASIHEPKVHVPSAVPKVQGMSTRDNWKADTVDLTALIKAAAENPGVYAQFLQANMPAINKILQATKGGFAIPGVVAKNEQSLVVR